MGEEKYNNFTVKNQGIDDSENYVITQLSLTNAKVITVKHLCTTRVKIYISGMIFYRNSFFYAGQGHFCGNVRFGLKILTIFV